MYAAAVTFSANVAQDGSNTALDGTDLYVMSVGGGTGVRGASNGNTTTLIDDILGQATYATSDFAANTLSSGSTPVMNGSHDLISNNSPTAPARGFTGSGSVTTGDPVLGPLAYNGGLTPTMALLPTSTAIGAGIQAYYDYPGTSDPITTDQRGFALDNPIDLGAFQPQTGLEVITNADGYGTAPGVLGLRQAINLANVLTGAQTITFDGSLTGDTITLVAIDPSAANVYGDTAFVVTGDITVDGAGASGLVISGNNMLRPFAATSTASLTLEDLTVEEGKAQGFAGGAGSQSNVGGGAGGGGAGMGGAVYDDGGTFTAEGVTFTNNQAVGGSGGNATSNGAAGGGGGGGLGGAGGAARGTSHSIGGLGGINGGGSGGNAGSSGHAGGFGGGGGGGGGSIVKPGGAGGFGGGGGGGGSNDDGSVGGVGGTAPGGIGGNGGNGGNVQGGGGGGGAGLGGGIFSNGGVITLVNDTFAANSATGGTGGDVAGETIATPGSDGSGYGGAVFAVNGTLTATYVTFSANIAQDASDTALDGTDIYVMSVGTGMGVRGMSNTTTLTDDILGQATAATSDFVANAISSGSTPTQSGTHDLISNNVPSSIDGLTSANGFTGSYITGNPLLSVLGSYGGDSKTLALLPGSPAIDAGTWADYPDTSTAIGIDQRGITRPQGSAYDIGAFESRGFTISVTAGNNQTAATGTAFTDNLEATVASGYSEPVVGGVVTWTVPGSGASATLSSLTVTIGAGGVVSVTATANGTAGSYSVTVTATGIATPASFSLTNAYQPVFSGLSNHTITYGTATVLFSGTIASGSNYPSGDDVMITLNSVEHDAVVQSDGSFSYSFSTALLDVAGSVYTVSYAFAAQGNFLAANDTSTLTVNKAPLTVTAELSTTDIGQGSAVPTPTFEYTGFVNSQTSSVVSGTPGTSWSPSTPTTSSAAGVYTITPTLGTLTAANYSFTTFDPASLNIHPVVDDILVEWGTESMSILSLSRDLPFTNIEKFEVEFSGDVNISGTGLALSSTVTGGPTYAPSLSTSGTGVTSATWTLPTAIGVDRLMLALEDMDITSVSGSLSLYGTTSKEFSVLPGDVTGDGVVNSADVTAVINEIGAAYDVWADLTGTGTVTTNDAKLARSKIGTQLPPPPP